MPSITRTTLARALRSLSPSTSAVSAMMPPSPWLSARMMNITYLTETTIVIDQNTSEITPYTSLGVAWTAWRLAVNTVCRAYSGLVPMSPNTTPSAPSVSPTIPPFAADAEIERPTSGAGGSARGGGGWRVCAPERARGCHHRAQATRDSYTAGY